MSKPSDDLKKIAVSPQTAAFVRSVAAPMLATLGTMGVIGGVNYYLSKKDQEAIAKGTQDAFHASFMKRPEFKENPGLFAQRFGELHVISPTIAQNPQLSSKLISDRLHTGFTVDDLHRLSTIEYHSSNTRRAPTPSAVARSSALQALTSTLQSLHPFLVQGISSGSQPPPEIVGEREPKMTGGIKRKLNFEEAEASAKELEEKLHEEALQAATQHIMTSPEHKEELAAYTAHGMDVLQRLQARKAAKQGAGMKKESSKRTVSDECVGIMLADRYVMAKTAGVFDTMSHGASALGGQLAFMAPALALGAGTILAQMAVNKMKSNAAETAADSAFASVRRSSEKIMENPAVAMEAFGALKSFAPDLAAKPNVLKTFVEHVIDTEGRMPIETIRSIADTQSVINKAQEPGPGGFVAGLKTPMSLLGLKAPEPKAMRRGHGALAALRKKVNG